MGEKMKIGICAFPLSKGKETGRGLERVIEEFCNSLTALKLEYSFYDKGIIRNEIIAIIKSIRYGIELFNKKDKCYFSVYPVSAIFPIFTGKHPHVTAVHDLIPFHVYGYDNKIKYAIKRWCIKYACVKSDMIIVPFLSTKNQIVEMFKVNPDKIKVIFYGVNHENYYVEEKIEKIENRIAFLGEAKRAKGMDSVIYAFSKVLKEIPNATLSLASYGNELEEMKALAKKELPEYSYQFLGFISEDKMRAFYSSAKVFLFPSRYGFGLSSLESMACGTPAIVGATLDATDFLTDEDLLVNPDAHEELAEKILALLKDSKKYEEKRTKCIEIAKGFSWNTMASRYYEVLVEAYKKINKK